MQKKKLSKKTEFLLFNILAQTHPDQAFVEWLADGEKDLSVQQQELLDAGYIESKEGSVVPTKAGLQYFKGENTDVTMLIKKLEALIPKNPNFEHTVRGLTNTALIRMFYTLLGEIGRRGDPDNQAAYSFWNAKCIEFEKALLNADPNTLWEKHGSK